MADEWTPGDPEQSVLAQIEALQTENARLRAQIAARDVGIQVRDEREARLRAVVDATTLLLVSGHHTREGVAFPEDRVDAARDAVRALDQREAT